jgi:hypothetical protein
MLIRGMFKVVERTGYISGRHVLVKLESTQVTSEMFAARIELMLTDVPGKDGFPLGAEVVIDFAPAAKQV